MVGAPDRFRPAGRGYLSAAGAAGLAGAAVGAWESVAPPASLSCTGLRMPANDTRPPAISSPPSRVIARWKPFRSRLAADDDGDHRDDDEPRDPRHRVVDGRGDARARSVSIEPRIAEVSGDTVSVRPMPNTRMPGSTCHQ